MVRSGNTHKPVVPDSSLAWSSDGGESWQPLYVPAREASGDDIPAEHTGNAAITVSADGSAFIVETTQPILTRDRGKSWKAIEGLPSRVRATADKADPKRFYAIDFAANHLVRSDDGGATFRPVASSGLPADLSGARAVGREAPNPLVATPGRAGALWLLIGSTLYRSTDFGTHWQRTSDFPVSRYGLGKGAPNSVWPALYAVGRLGEKRGIYRSLDGGGAWQRINDDAHQWGLRFRMVSGDPRRFGRVYVATDGRGIVYGDPKEGTK